MTDTAGYTDTIFGIFHLLGLQFSPRIADIGGARFWRVDGKADYGILDGLAANRINTKLTSSTGTTCCGSLGRSSWAWCARPG